MKIKTIKEAIKEVLDKPADSMRKITPDELKNMSTAEYLAHTIVAKTIRKGSTNNVVDLAKITGDLNNDLNVNFRNIDTLLKDCEASDDSSK